MDVRTLNRVILVGRVCQDPEAKEAGSNVVCKVQIATNETYTSGGRKVESSDFIPCVFWGKKAEIMENYVKKGDMLIIEGRLKNNDYEKDGVKIYGLEVRVDNMTMTGSKGGSQDQDEEKGTGRKPQKKSRRASKDGWKD